MQSPRIWRNAQNQINVNRDNKVIPAADDFTPASTNAPCKVCCCHCSADGLTNFGEDVTLAISGHTIPEGECLSYVSGNSAFNTLIYWYKYSGQINGTYTLPLIKNAIKSANHCVYQLELPSVTLRYGNNDSFFFNPTYPCNLLRASPTDDCDFLCVHTGTLTAVVQVDTYWTKTNPSTFITTPDYKTYAEASVYFRGATGFVYGTSLATILLQEVVCGGSYSYPNPAYNDYTKTFYYTLPVGAGCGSGTFGSGDSNCHFSFGGSIAVAF